MALAKVEQGKGEHAAEFGEAVFAPFLPGVYEDFGIGLRGETMAAEDEAFTKLAIVVKFAVENNGDVVIFVPNGLMAAGKVDDAEAAHAQRETGSPGLGQQETFFIRTAMKHGRGHGANAGFGFRGAGSECDATDTAHASVQSPE